MWDGVRRVRAVLVTRLRIVGRPVPPKVKLTSQELTVCVQLLGRGRTLVQAIDAIETQRAFIAQYHLKLSPK